jgi:hypothetical protein
MAAKNIDFDADFESVENSCQKYCTKKSKKHKHLGISAFSLYVTVYCTKVFGSLTFFVYTHVEEKSLLGVILACFANF